MKTIFTSLFLTTLLLIGCGGNDSKNDSLNADTTDIVADATQDSIRHTKEYIAQRIDTIYKYKDDMRFCSAKYLSLDAHASKLSHEMGYVYRDYDHWVMGQDIDPKWSYKIKDIKDIKAVEATVEVLVHNFKNQHIILNLVYERGDWYVDNFRTSFSGKSPDEVEGEKYDMLNFIHNCSNEKLEKKYGQSFDISKYLESMTNDMIYEYALIDIDLDGNPELWVRNEEGYYDAVYSIADKKADLLAEADGRTALVFYENGVGSQGSCGTGCAQNNFCILKNSRAIHHVSWVDVYSFDSNGDFASSESNYNKDDKECTEKEALELSEQLGESYSINPTWHSVDITRNKALSNYAE
jgi:hypothetical protein